MVGYQAGRELVDLTCQVTSERHVAEIDARLGDGDHGGSDALAIHHSKGGLHVPIRIIDSRNRISDSHTAHGLKEDGGDNVVMDVEPTRSTLSAPSLSRKRHESAMSIVMGSSLWLTNIVNKDASRHRR